MFCVSVTFKRDRPILMCMDASRNQLQAIESASRSFTRSFCKVW